jgi:hypothetical protein
MDLSFVTELGEMGGEQGIGHGDAHQPGELSNGERS